MLADAANLVLTEPGATSSERHARLHLDAVVARIMARLGEDVPEWLRADVDAAGPAPRGGPGVFERELDAFEDLLPSGAPAPLMRLDRGDARLLAAIGLIEEDVRFGALFASLQEPLASRRPCVGLLGWLLGRDEDGVDPQQRAQHLVDRGLLRIENATDPRSEWVPRLPVPVWDLVRHGRPRSAGLPPTLRHVPGHEFPALADVVLTRPAAQAAARLAALVCEGGVSAVVVRGMDGSGRLTLLGAVARALGEDVFVHEGAIGDAGWALLAPLADLARAFPVVVAAPGLGETLRLPSLPGLEHPLGVVVGPGGGLAGPPTERAVSLVLGPCRAEGRRRLWTASVAASPEDLDRIVESFLLTPGNIRRAARLATAAVAADGRAQVTPADVRASTRALQSQTLETLATRLEPLRSAAAPVMGLAAAEEVATLLARCRQREALAGDGGGLRDAANRGVRALFTGPSGTGKTLTARYVAEQLQLDVYRVDLASVVNKYIGETERNLDSVLSRAEELDVLLLLDEGDALLTRRTEVSSANDRYANLETNFLLQRLETFDGIVVVTTNAGSRIDPAFLRRIDVTVDFTPPDAAQRLDLWRAHLPDDHDATVDLLHTLARRCVLTGGQIRNAAQHARLVRLEQSRIGIGDGRVVDADVLAAVRREYRRTGASFPLGDGTAGRSR